eukprot:CAMPEP_0170162672 /NCGR_PEP_ID=MMETSP0033_2-20121228/77211_1 /TAXON_ID=195969 /ORGANISM="Dolichomastix tenuilepis, Strain CCMP3274" /LENGTH=511 /DNA_ID=CAMNT_0010400299 /DNA_START=17 /DNA_END=1552 /DNA_ORIENTATION=+
MPSHTGETAPLVGTVAPSGARPLFGRKMAAAVCCAVLVVTAFAVHGGKRSAAAHPAAAERTADASVAAADAGVVAAPAFGFGPPATPSGRPLMWPTTHYVWVIRHSPENAATLQVHDVTFYTGDDEFPTQVVHTPARVTAGAESVYTSTNPATGAPVENPPSMAYDGSGATYFQDSQFESSRQTVLHFDFASPVSIARFEYTAGFLAAMSPMSWSWYASYGPELYELQRVDSFTPPQLPFVKTRVPAVFLQPVQFTIPPPSAPPPMPPPMPPPPGTRIFTGCVDVLSKVPNAVSDFYNIRVNDQTIRMYCNFGRSEREITTETGPVNIVESIYYCHDCPSVSKMSQPNGCTALGLELLVPRTKYFWENLYVWSFDVTSQPVQSFWQTVPIVKSTSGATSKACSVMNSGNCTEWEAIDGGDWWLRNTPFEMPGSDYEEGCFLGLAAAGWQGDINNIVFGSNGCQYETGPTYLCSLNEPYQPPMQTPPAPNDLVPAPPRPNSPGADLGPYHDP